jgi:hypothetical protein
MLATLLAACLCCPVAQEPFPVAMAGAVAVRGEAELSPAAALASAQRKAEDHVRSLWQGRADRTVAGHRPFWLPDLLAQQAVRRWLADLPVEQVVRVVDREDREREHEFGNSWQTTLWVAEEPRAVQQRESLLRRELRRLERTTAVKYGGVVAGWVALALVLGWIDRPRAAT